MPFTIHDFLTLRSLPTESVGIFLFSQKIFRHYLLALELVLLK